MNICIKIFALVTSYVTNHNKNVRMHHLVLVIAPLRIFKMAATENSKSLHVFHAPHIVLPIETTGAYHHNFGLHVNICMIFCVLMASCITNHIKCEDPTSIPSPWSGKTGNGARHYRHIFLPTWYVSLATWYSCTVHQWRYIFEGPYVHENRHCLRTLMVVWEHVQLCHMNLHIAAGTSVYMWAVKVTNALVTCGTTLQHSHADFFTLCTMDTRSCITASSRRALGCSGSR